MVMRVSAAVGVMTELVFVYLASLCVSVEGSVITVRDAPVIYAYRWAVELKTDAINWLDFQLYRLRWNRKTTVIELGQPCRCKGRD